MFQAKAPYGRCRLLHDRAKPGWGCRLSRRTRIAIVGVEAQSSTREAAIGKAQVRQVLIRESSRTLTARDIGTDGRKWGRAKRTSPPSWLRGVVERHRKIVIGRNRIGVDPGNGE